MAAASCHAQRYRYLHSKPSRFQLSSLKTSMEAALVTVLAYRYCCDTGVEELTVENGCRKVALVLGTCVSKS